MQYFLSFVIIKCEVLVITSQSSSNCPEIILLITGILNVIKMQSKTIIVFLILSLIANQVKLSFYRYYIPFTFSYYIRINVFRSRTKCTANIVELCDMFPLLLPCLILGKFAAATTTTAAPTTTEATTTTTVAPKQP